VALLVYSLQHHWWVGRVIAPVDTVVLHHVWHYGLVQTLLEASMHPCARTIYTFTAAAAAARHWTRSRLINQATHFKSKIFFACSEVGSSCESRL
jgi:hypothetical protein